MKILRALGFMWLIGAGFASAAEGERSLVLGQETTPAAPRWYPSIGLGVPHPLSLSVTWNISPEWSTMAGVGLLLLPLGSERSVSYLSVQGAARWHPFWDSFFVGGEIGVQSVGLRNLFPASLGGASLGTSSLLTLQNAYVCPLVGAEWKYTNGWRLTLMAGWQIPLFASGGVSGTSSTEFEAGSQRSLASIAALPIPLFGVHVGKTF